jgi:hypothetical protein
MDTWIRRSLLRARSSPASLLGFAAVAAARLLTLPQSLWEWDEVLFVRGILFFDPVHHSPHPPGYPLLIGLGKMVNAVVGDPFASLVALSVVASLVSYAALVSAFRRFALPLGDASPEALAAGERAAVAGALLFHFSASMLVYGPLALSDGPALMFLSLALAAAARLPESGSWRPALALGVFASAAIGCRPQLCLSVLPMTAAALALTPSRRRTGAALAAFTFVSLLWFVPLLVAVGGEEGFVSLMGKQAGLVTAYDTDLPRASRSAVQIAMRFVAHPWGDRWTSLPVLAFAALGSALLVRRRRVLPLAVLTAVELAFCLLVLNPDDGVRYALPSLLGISFATGVGCEALARRVRVPAAAYGVAALIAAGCVVFAWPLLLARTTTESPPAQAARWIRESAPAGTVVLVDKDLAAHASYLIPRRTRYPVEVGLERHPGRHGTPAFLYGDGKSGWKGALTFEWPASDAYGKLTRGLYRVVTVSPVPPTRRYQVVRGVHDYEPTARERGWRWMEPDAAIRIYPRGNETVALTLGLSELAPWPAVQVDLSVNGVSRATVEIPRGDRRRLRLPLPTAEAVEIEFRSGAFFVPAEAGLNRADKRRLAVQLLDVEQLGR